ncbi:MAG TPA: flagellin [Syntrophorhabdaceae bacterium]|nr:flagellin [Syntrophorhabdaceae bacterium]
MSSDITLTSSMRANLLALQSTVTLMGRTQERLANGKKVNSALDNAVSYFTAQSLTSRSSDLLNYKDAISQSIQTIKAADNAITSITTMINSAIGVAQDAMSKLGSAAYNQTLTINNLTGMTSGQTIAIGNSIFTAVTTAASASATNFYIGGATSDAAISLAQAINLTTETRTKMTATVQNSTITINPTTAGMTMVATDLGFAAALSSNLTASSIGSGVELASKVSQYNTMMAQLNTMKSDAFYNGKNLLNSETMTVRFGNSHTLSVVGFDSSASGLGLNATATWTSETTIQADIDNMNNALTSLRVNSSSLSSNLAIVNARNQWISDVSNTLQTGADSLVNADTNEEGANMLALQTRQSLSTSALSLASQSNQSVLKLFQ